MATGGRGAATTYGTYGVNRNHGEGGGLRFRGKRSLTKTMQRRPEGCVKSDRGRSAVLLLRQKTRAYFKNLQLGRGAELSRDLAYTRTIRRYSETKCAQVFEWFSTKMYSTKLSPDGWYAGIILRARRP